MARTVIHLYNISVEAPLELQPSILPDTKLLVQLSIGDNIVLQTDLVDKIPEQYLWKFDINSKLPSDTNLFSIFIVQAHSEKGTHLLGLKEFNKDEIASLTWEEDLSQALVNIQSVNGGPSFKLIVGLSQSASVLNPTFYHINADKDKIGSLSSHIIYSELEPMLQCIKDGNEVDPLDISLMYERILLLPNTNDKKAYFLHKMGNIYLECWEKSQEILDLHQAISVFNAAIQYCLPDDSARGKYLGSYAGALFSRFQELDEVEDLNEVILMEEKAEHLAPNGHPNRAQCLHSLGNSLLTRFERLGQLDDLYTAISKEEEAVVLTSDNSDKPAFLSGLGQSLICLFEQSDNPDDLDRAILQFQKAVELTADNDPDKAIWFNNLGNALLAHFEKAHNPSDIDQSVSHLEKALKLTSEEDSALPDRLSNLGIALSSKFEHSGSKEDLDSSIKHTQKAVELCPDEPLFLYNLGCTLSTRFDFLCDPSDIDQAVKHYQDAVDLTPHDHLHKPERLRHLGSSLYARFEQSGNVKDIDQAVSELKKAVNLISDNTSEKAQCLHGLGVALHLQFQQNGKVQKKKIDQAVSNALKALALAPKNHPDRSIYLAGLGHSLLCRFEHFGVLSDITQALSSLEEALEKNTDKHRKAGLLNSLSYSYLCHFRQVGDASALNKSVARSRAAVDLTPDGHFHKATRLTSLANCLICSFEHSGGVQNLNQSISCFEKAIELTQDHNPLQRSLQLEYLSVALLYHSKHTKNPLNDLREALAKLEEAVKITPHNHPSLSFKLDALSNVLFQCFLHTGELGQLNESVLKSREAIQLCPDGDPNKSGLLSNLAEGLAFQSTHSQNSVSLEEALQQYSLAAHCTTSPSSIRLNASHKWMDYAQSCGHESLWDACKTALHLLPQTAWLGLPISNRYEMLKQAGTIVRDATSAAIEAGKYSNAVEWLEQGRAIVWSQLLQLRTSPEELRSKYPKIAEHLMEISRVLEYKSNKDVLARSTLSPQQNSQSAPLSYHQLALERDQLISKIRTFPGFKEFLLPKAFSELKSAAHNGPIIIVNMGSFSCDALAIMPRQTSKLDSSSVDGVVHIPLQKFTLGDAQRLRERLRNILQGSRYDSGWTLKSALMESRLDIQEEDDTQDGTDPETTLAQILSELWIGIIRPILYALNIKNPSQDINDLTHVWWCPTGPLTFLPIHAAGIYGPEEQLGSKLADYVVSSYTPTLTTLINSSHSKVQEQPSRLLTVALPSESRLPGTKKEHEILGKYQRVIPVTQLFEGEATVANVKKAMLKSEWVHFACHGVQDITDPTSSALKLAGYSKLALSEIIELNLPHAKLAFLSACQTATGDESVQEEAVHLAAGMLLAGYQGVIATMWAIGDWDAPEVAESVYDYLFSQSPPDSTQAAVALHLATQKLRKRGDSLFSWVPFIHMGA